LAGPPGAGKTLLAELAAAELGLELFALNASDERAASKLGFLKDVATTRSLFNKGRLILIDEADGLSGRDRGAVAAIESLIERSRFPVVLVANDPYAEKLRPLRQKAVVIKLTRVPAPSIEKRLRAVAAAEGIEAPEAVLKGLARWSSGDLRSALTDFQLLCQGRTQLTEADAAALGARERPKQAYETLPALFRSKSLSGGRRALQDSDVDSDELLLWASTNLPAELPKDKLPEAYALLAQADVFRGRVLKSQHWRFKAYASDLLAGLATLGGGSGYVSYQRPDRIAILGATRMQRAVALEKDRALAARLHCSVRKVREQLPLLRLTGAL
ncbi:MAG TPA: AAA family ATPase, partial [archaeon]|nr:AAA family ATPase [archaeon]